MSIQIHIDTATAEEAIGIMRAFIASMTPAPTLTPAAAEITERVKTTRKPKATAPIEKAPESEITDIEPVDEKPVEEPKAEMPPPTEEQVKDAIKALNAAHGEDACWALLKKFDAKKRSEVKDTRAFVVEAKFLAEASKPFVADFVKEHGAAK